MRLRVFVCVLVCLCVYVRVRVCACLRRSACVRVRLRVYCVRLSDLHGSAWRCEDLCVLRVFALACVWVFLRVFLVRACV